MAGCKRRKVEGNFVGGPDTALKFGGCLVVDSSGQIRYAQQEGVAPINYDDVNRALSEI
eukprot:CAMPEP_0171112562 /NCGR_PEP_ID=MMETSP0766_2-20121228/79503_1 /TAXON_ID=439317 /ORGANISM="Gambierdiscus australes, Strain CAWD 149" /LENGTH=58 /DNA_ID=CAMNT_0011574679 /DNA_START=232 /DNA_END=408 /DNA_ORIENTATION=+